MAGLFVIINVQADVFYADFTATVSDDDTIILEWWTNSEVDNQAFYIQRSLTDNSLYSRLSTSYTQSQSGNGEGGYYYFYEDNSVVRNQTYYYRIEAINFQGVSSFFGPVHATILDVITPTSTLTRTGTISPQPTSGAPAATLPALTASALAGITQTNLPQPNLSLTRTSGIPVETEVSPFPNLTTTATASKTLEPLPTIELIFPDTPTSQIIKKDVTATMQLVVQPIEVETQAAKVSIRNLPSRLIVLVGVVGLLWLCLALLLVYLLRKLS